MTINEPTVLLITFGRPRGPRSTGPRDRLDAGGTRLRLRSLHVMGHGSARIARALGVRQETVGRLVRGDARAISPQLRDAVAALYDAWWDKRAPERTRAERMLLGAFVDVRQVADEQDGPGRMLGVAAGVAVPVEYV